MRRKQTVRLYHQVASILPPVSLKLMQYLGSDSGVVAVLKCSSCDLYLLVMQYLGSCLWGSGCSKMFIMRFISSCNAISWELSFIIIPSGGGNIAVDVAIINLSIFVFIARTSLSSFASKV